MKKVLIVDDHQDHHVLLKFQLRNDLPGVIILEAANGEDALKIYQQEQPEVVITDTHMPKMNGWAMVEEILKTGNPFIIACSDLPVSRRKFPDGIPFLLKPLSLDLVLSYYKNWELKTVSF